jgi:hypothetical protein
MLWEEAKYLHICMFRRHPSNVIFEAYIRAHAEIPDLCVFDERQLKTVRAVVVQCMDAVGIEPWLRGKRVRHALSAKMLLLAYLAECDSCHPEFSRRASVGRMAVVNMGCAALKAGLCLLRGRIQKAWYGLV